PPRGAATLVALWGASFAFVAVARALARARARRVDLEQMTILGGVDELPRLVEERGIERVVVAFSQTPEPRVLELVRSLVSTGVAVDVVPRLFESLSPAAAIDSLEGLPLVSAAPRVRPRGYALAKRALDVVG